MSGRPDHSWPTRRVRLVSFTHSTIFFFDLLDWLSSSGVGRTLSVTARMLCQARSHVFRRWLSRFLPLFDVVVFMAFST